MNSPEILPYDQTVKKIQDSVWEWLSIVAPEQLRVDPIEWIINYQGGSMPNRPFGTIYFSQANRMLSQQNTKTVWDEDNQVMKEITQMPLYAKIDLSVFGDDADNTLIDLFLTIDTQRVRDLFWSKGIRYASRNIATNITKLVNKKYEDRATQRITLFTIFSNEYEIDTIDTAVINGTITDKGLINQIVNINVTNEES